LLFSWRLHQIETRNITKPHYELAEFPVSVTQSVFGIEGVEGDFLIDESISAKPSAVYQSRIKIHEIRQGKPSLLLLEDPETDLIEE
jgi:hypothetical protein